MRGMKSTAASRYTLDRLPRFADIEPASLVEAVEQNRRVDLLLTWRPAARIEVIWPQHQHPVLQPVDVLDHLAAHPW